MLDVFPRSFLSLRPYMMSRGFAIPIPSDWTSAEEGTVVVNQRALIDKILARYAGDFTTFRELLQNSDDAGAKVVDIRFETQAYIYRNNDIGHGPNVINQALDNANSPDWGNTEVYQWSLSNSKGRTFDDNDWERLRTIASGNPVEDKIGAFGVGFYSIFAVTDEPSVASGGRWMRFYWKDGLDQLFFRQGSLLESTSDGCTIFNMKLRKPQPMPHPKALVQFLSSSITFMAQIAEVNVFLDDKQLLAIKKRTLGSSILEIPVGMIVKRCGGFMSIQSLQSTAVVIDVELSSDEILFEDSAPPLTPTSTSSHDDRLANVQEHDNAHSFSLTMKFEILSATVTVDFLDNPTLLEELRRTTKKEPPHSFQYDLVYTDKLDQDGNNARGQYTLLHNEIFRGLRAELNGSTPTYLFIGHATHQTTGVGGPMASRFIPTVERELIDLCDGSYAAVWNKELLYVGGFLLRYAYEREMKNIRDDWNAKDTGADFRGSAHKQGRLRGRAMHIMKFCAFHRSTSSALISRYMKSAFFDCADRALRPFLIISSEGVVDILDVRHADNTVTSFLKHFPTFFEGDLREATGMVRALEERGLIQTVSAEDIQCELQRRPLDLEDAVTFLQWLIHQSKDVDALLQAAVVCTEESPNIQVRLGDIRSVRDAITGPYVPAGGPLPGYLLPHAISRRLASKYVDTSGLPIIDALLSIFSWKGFGIVEWLIYILDFEVGQGCKLSESRARQILDVLALGWQSLAAGDRKVVLGKLKGLECIPTTSSHNCSLKKPSDAYFKSVDLFHDLPVVNLSPGSDKNEVLLQVLRELGVRTRVDLQSVFHKMGQTSNEAAKWTVLDVVRYFTTIRLELSEEELSRLRDTKAFYPERSRSLDLCQRRTRCVAGDLYEPTSSLRGLKLPIVDLEQTGSWQSSSDIASFMFELGLKRQPSLEWLLVAAGSADVEVRPRALTYLFDNWPAYEAAYDPLTVNTPFIPAVRARSKCVAKPMEVFKSARWDIMGFAIIDKEWRKHADIFKIPENPTPQQILRRLIETAGNIASKTAGEQFELIARHWLVNCLSQDDREKLAGLRFIPVSRKDAPSIIDYVSPRECFVMKKTTPEIQQMMFHFVHFGELANSFLTEAGTPPEGPSTVEIMQKLITSPERFLSCRLPKDRDLYERQLKTIALNASAQEILDMKASSGIKLLGFRSELTADPESISDDAYSHVYDFCPVDKIFVADDPAEYQHFCSSGIHFAPQDDLLEDFYIQLGARRLSTSIQEDLTEENEMISSPNTSTSLRKLVLYRLQMFLFGHTKGNFEVLREHFVSQLPGYPKLSSSGKLAVLYHWLQDSEENFTISLYKTLSVWKSLKGLHNTREAVSSSAAARWNGRRLELYVLAPGQEPDILDGVDMYGLSSALCRCLIESPKASDILIFATILEPYDLKPLERRGYSLSHIKNRYDKAEKEAREVITKLIIAPPASQAVTPRFSPDTAPENLSLAQDALVDDNIDTGGSPRAYSYWLLSSWLFIMSSSWLQTLASRVAYSRSTNHRCHVVQVFSPDHIDVMVTSAVRACSEDNSDLLSASLPQIVHEFRFPESDGRCLSHSPPGVKDFTRHDVSLDSMGIVTIFLRSVSSFPSERNISLLRFIRLLDKLCEVFGMPARSIHVFVDGDGPCIAFNRACSLHVNFRFYERLHDNKVKAGDPTNAYVSWYLSLAHEIAHSYVHEHNAAHEFLFSSICEKYWLKLMELIQGAKMESKLVEVHPTA